MRIDGRRAAGAIGLVLALLVSACGSMAPSASGAKEIPLADPSVRPTPTPAPGSVVACPPSEATLSIEFESPVPSAIAMPSAIPPDLPADPIPSEANVYAVGVPGDPATGTAEWRYWVVGPAAAPCTVDLGNYRQVDVTQSPGAYVTVFFPGAVEEALTLVCAYVADALATYEASGGDAAQCLRGGGPGGTGETVVPLTTAIRGVTLAGVVEPKDKAIPSSRDVVLYAFAISADGKSFQSANAECVMPTAAAKVCDTAFTYFLAQLDSAAGWGLGAAKRGAIVKQLADAAAKAG